MSIESGSMRRLRNVSSIKGFANFNRRFIRSFSTVSTPLTDLLIGGKRSAIMHFIHSCNGPDARHAFRTLEKAFSKPMLKLPDPEKPFLVVVDESEVGLGAVLSELLKSVPCCVPVCLLLTEIIPGRA